MEILITYSLSLIAAVKLLLIWIVRIAIIYTNLFGNLGESISSFNDIGLEKFDKEIPIKLSLRATPVKDTPSISKLSIIPNHENYIDENYNKAAKIQLKQTILPEIKQLSNKIKEVGHLDRLLHNLHSQIFSLKSKIGFLR